MQFSIDDGVNPTYTRHLGDTDVMRTVKLKNDPDAAATDVWVGYERIAETGLGAFGYGRTITISVSASNRLGDAITPVAFDFRIETESKHQEAESSKPETAPVAPSDPDLGGNNDAGFQVIGGDLAGTKVLYDSHEPVVPEVGPQSDIPP